MPDEQPTVTGRPNDIPIDDPDRKIPEVLKNSTLSQRAKARKGAKKVDAASAQNKAVTSSASKRSSR